MLVLGLTGGSGCGKGYVAKLFLDQGVRSIDCDEVFHTLCVKNSPCLREIAQALGNEVLTPEGEYDRQVAAGIVFADAEKLRLLNTITHRHILDYCRAWLREREEAGDAYAIIDAPVLYESGFDAECDAVIAVICDQSERIRRIVQRDGISNERALARIAKQKDEAFFRQRADYLIVNGADATKEDLIAAVNAILKELAEKAGGV